MPSRGYVKVQSDGTAVLVGAKSISQGALPADQVLSSMKQNTGSLTIGLSGVYGTAVVLRPVTGFNALTLALIQYVLGGTFGSETVTVKVLITYVDGTTSTYTAAGFTSTGTVNKTDADYLANITDNKNIASVAISATTSAGSTSVTAAVTIEGKYTV